MTTYWKNDGKYSHIVERLNDFVPASGQVENPKDNPALERFRVASNLYYEIFNNGCINGAGGAKDLFGISGYHLKRLCRYEQWEEIHKYTETAMDEIIVEAAQEQDII